MSPFGTIVLLFDPAAALLADAESLHLRGARREEQHYLDWANKTLLRGMMHAHFERGLEQVRLAVGPDEAGSGIQEQLMQKFAQVSAKFEERQKISKSMASSNESRQDLFTPPPSGSRSWQPLPSIPIASQPADERHAKSWLFACDIWSATCDV
jgi:hypothetical protein